MTPDPRIEALKPKTDPIVLTRAEAEQIASAMFKALGHSCVGESDLVAAWSLMEDKLQ